jgi:chromosomal replication initiator protein
VRHSSHSNDAARAGKTENERRLSSIVADLQVVGVQRAAAAAVRAFGMPKEVTVITCMQDAGTDIETRIAAKLGTQKYGVWFKNATKLTLTDRHVHVSAPNHFVSDFIERNFTDTILEAGREVTGSELTLSFAIDPDLARRVDKKQPDRQVEFVASQPERRAREHRRAGSLPEVTHLKGAFADFVVGASNRLAHAAALSVAENPATQYNPLFIHGGCGLGKTHLLQAVCNAFKEKHPQLRWRYVTGEDFTNDFICAVKGREMNAFHDRYRNLDALVIDDVHFLANKRATQDGFLQTFKAIDAAGKQIVLASDAHPKLIGQFSDSLVSRFLAGMVVRIDAPDFDVRVNVLRRRAERLKADISDAVLQHIAESFRTNIRELEGALLKVFAHAQVTGQPISTALADQALRDLARHTAPVVLLADIENTVSIHFGLRPADLHTSRKSRTIALARGIAMYLARKHTDLSFPEIGRFMGNKNHSTVILANRRIGALLNSNASVQWLTPAGPRNKNIAIIVEDLEEQVIAGNGLPATRKT